MTEHKALSHQRDARRLRVMVVDDESIVRKDIRSLLDWEKYGYELTAEAGNGQVALQLLKTHSIDIIIADIQMPVMNGIQLAAEALAERKNIRFIFLTAYNDFEFARASLRLGVNSYILKHELSAPLLLSELDRLRGEIRQLDRRSMALMNDGMRSLLQTSQTDAACTGLMNELGIVFRPGGSLIIQMVTRRADGLDEWKKAAWSAVGDVTARYPNMSAASYSFDSSSVGALVTLHEDRTSAQPWSPVVRQCADELQCELRRRLGYSCFILISETIPRPGAINAYYQNIQKWLDRLFFYGAPCVVLCAQQPPKPINADDELKLAADFIGNRQFVDAESAVNMRLIPRLAEQMDPTLCKKALAILGQRIADIWNAHYTEDGGVKDAVELYHSFVDSANIFETGDKIAALLTRMREMQLEKRKVRMHVINEYMEKHYTEDVSLSALAESLSISEAYMSQLFRREMGMSFKVFLKELRMKKAGELLLAGDMKLTDISLALGYNSVQYFCMVFKQYYDVTPSQYVRRALDI